MSSIYQYRKVAEDLTRSQDRFEEVNRLFPAGNTEQGVEELKQRWQAVLGSGSQLAGFVRDHHRSQHPAVLSHLQELAKYADVTRPYRLSIIGQKGVGKSALVNALLGATGLNYTPSEVAGKAVSGTRVRLVSTEEPAPAWKVVFLTPRRLWEAGSHLLQVARLPLPAQPADLDNSGLVLAALSHPLEEKGEAVGGLGSTLHIQAAGARDTLGKMLEVYRTGLPEGYILEIDEPEVDGPVGRYIRQTPENLYLIVDYVERAIPAEEAGFLAGRRLELEDVLGLDDPRDSFFALEAFRDSFAVILAFKCDRGLNTESSSLMEYLFSRDEAELARYGSLADLNKAIIVANQFDVVVSGTAQDGQSSPLKGIEDIRRELARYTSREVPVFLTSAQLAQTARQVLLKPETKTSSGYSSYLTGLANLLAVVDEKGLAPDYLDFIQARRAEIETGAELEPAGQAKLILELSGLPRLATQVEQALEAGSILRGRVANAEYYHSRAISEIALAYARQMQKSGLGLDEFSQPPASLESRLFTRFQYEMREKLEEIDRELRAGYFELSQKLIHGPMPAVIEQARQNYLDTIRAALLSNRQLIMNQPHISSGETVTDAWRKVFEDINDWLALEMGRQMRSLVSPALVELEKLTGRLQLKLSGLVAGSLDENFWQGYRQRLDTLRQRLLNHAELMAVSYYTDNRFSVYDLQIAETLHVGEPTRRREDVIRLLQERVLSWFNDMWRLLARVSMTELSGFVSESRYYSLGLSAEGNLLAGLEVTGSNNAGLPPAGSLVAILNHRYHTEESFRQQYARREPSPKERLAGEIRDWLGLVRPPLDGFGELGRAVALVGVARPEGVTAQAEDGAESPTAETKVSPTLSVGGQGLNVSFNRLRVPVESRHPYSGVTRQVWEITNPDTEAAQTRLHFSRIDLSGTGDRLILSSLGKAEEQVIEGQHQDYWSKPFSGRTVTVRFVSDNPGRTGWGFALDGTDSPVVAGVR